MVPESRRGPLWETSETAREFAPKSWQTQSRITAPLAGAGVLGTLGISSCVCFF